MTILRDKLTVLLPLKGREDFTARWLNYHSAIGLDCKVIIGDGDLNSDVEAVIDTCNAPFKLDYEYKKYNDSDLTRFYEKLLSLVESSETKYVMLADNDDFILPTGVARSIEFLEDNPDYVSCGGANLGIYGAPRGLDLSKFPAALNDEWVKLGFIYSQLSVDQESAEERVVVTREKYQPTWYCVHRADCLRECFRSIIESGIKDVYVMELYQALFMASKGKVRQDYKQAVYVRQLNSSVCAAGSSNDVFSRMFTGTMVDDYRSLWGAVAKVAAETDHKDVGDVEATISQACIAKERSEATVTINLDSRFSRCIGAWNYSFRAKLPFYHQLMQRTELKNVIRVVQQNSSCDNAYSSALRAELEAVFKFMKSA